MFDGEEQPNHNPEEQMQYSSNDADEGDVIETSPVYNGVVVEKGRVADADRYEDTESGTVREIAPPVASLAP